MKRPIVVLALVTAVAVAILVVAQLQPPRLTASTLEKAREVQQKLDQEAAAKPAETQTVAQAAPAPAKPQEAPKPPEAAKPEGGKVFKVKFECSNGTFTVEVNPEWAPLGAARFEQLVKEGVYNEGRFFRVVPGFVVQFGIPGDPAVAKKWRDDRIKDDPAKQSNAAGTITFATSGPNTRTSQLFINLVNNARLDNMGFTPFGKVTEGFDVVKAISSEYQDFADQGLIQAQGNEYLKKSFPKMDYIKSATIVP